MAVGPSPLAEGLSDRSTLIEIPAGAPHRRDGDQVFFTSSRFDRQVETGISLPNSSGAFRLAELECVQPGV